MGAAWIPEILRAKRELMREAMVHRFGVLRSSLDSRGTGNEGRGAPPGALGVSGGRLGAHYDYGVGGLYLDVAAHSDPAEVAAVALTALGELPEGARSGGPDSDRRQRATDRIVEKAARAIQPAQADDAWAMLQVLGLADLATDHGGGTFGGIRYLHPVPNTLMLAAARYLADSKDRWLDRNHCHRTRSPEDGGRRGMQRHGALNGM